MFRVETNSQRTESCVRQTYHIPSLLMMEHAAKAIAQEIQNISIKNKLPDNSKVCIFCGRGNNGSDGFALARLIQQNFYPIIFCKELPKTDEGKIQVDMCKALGIRIEADYEIFFKEKEVQFIIDCIYGTGFHGKLSEELSSLFTRINSMENIRKIACDIPSGNGLENSFKADCTITMGNLKLSLFSDNAKNNIGDITAVPLGISSEKFNLASDKVTDTKIFLIEKKDVKLPFRNDKSVHKGKFGHTAVFTGQKPGAAILAATAAMKFGSGLTSIVKCKEDAYKNLSFQKATDFERFKLNPELMLCDELPTKTTCILAGSGFTEVSSETFFYILQHFKNQKNPAAVFDAGFLTSKEFINFWKEIDEVENARIILTPHLFEFTSLIKNLIQVMPERFFKELSDKKAKDEIFAKNPMEKASIEKTPLKQDFLEKDFPKSYSEQNLLDFYSTSELSSFPEKKVQLGIILNEIFPNTAIIIKSANSFIAFEKSTFIIHDGRQNLAKGGSGDILAGMTAALLAQGYPTKDAAISAAKHHALISQKFLVNDYSITPENLLNNI